MHFDENYTEKSFRTLQNFALVGLRNLKIRHRLILSYSISTVLPLVAVYIYTYFRYGTSSITGQVLVLSLLMACVSMTMTTYTYLSISSPINQMVETCQTISDGDMEKRIHDQGNDELAFLSDNIDSMVTEIQLLLEQRQQSEAKKRELELKMLQYQINPHFLFNTLNTLRLVAQMNQDKVVAEGICSLSELLKNTLINDHEFITIREENSVLHGSYNDGTIMEIFVRCFRKQDDIVLEVADLGKGFDMNDKASAPKGLGGIGSRNVNDRIHLYFSNNYGLTVTSAPGKGTTCRILIPAIVSETEDAKGGNYVSSTDRR